MTKYIWEIDASSWFYYIKKRNLMMSKWIGHVALNNSQKDVVRRRKVKRKPVKTAC
jgi:hypothetical protein